MFTLTDTNETISPSLTLTKLQAMRIAPQVKFQYARMKAGEVTAELNRAFVNSQPFHVTFHFHGEPLHAIQLMARDEAAGLTLPRPGEWINENEIARKAWHEAWAKDTFGRALEMKPIVLDAGSPPIMPANPGPEHPRYAILHWGSVTSFLDQKGGFAFLWIE